MTTRKPEEGTLDAMDFMMMDVHRPLTDAEISTIHPQATVDKSAGAKPNGHGDPPGVDTSYPHECPLPENVVLLNNGTQHDLSAVEILRHAHDAGLVELVVVGIGEDQIERVFRTNSSMPRAMWWLIRGQHILNTRYDNRIDEILSGDEDEPA